MSFLCGWITGRPVTDPDRVLDDMTVPPLLSAGMCARRAGEPNVGLCVLARQTDGNVCVGDGLYAAVEGYPRWRAARYAEAARRDGHASALTLAYRELGKGVLEQVDGPSVLAVIDKARDRAILAIDRVGVRPLCYASLGSAGLVFGTTTDSVRAHPFVDTTINYQAISDYLFFTRVPAPETIYGEVHKLMPGQYLSYEKGRVDVGFYWQLSYEAGEAGRGQGFAELATEMKQVLNQALDRSLSGLEAATVGAYLSGGLDSSTLVGLLAERAPDTATAFTIGFDEPGYDELTFARAAAQHFRVKHREYIVTPDDIVAAAPELAATYDEPYANTSAVAAYYCARLAKEEGMAVLLAGDGGDELFAGNARYATQRVFEAYGQIPEILRRRAIEPLVSGLPGNSWLIRKGRSYVRQAAEPLPDRLEINNHYLTFALADCFRADLAARIDQRHGLDLMRFHFGSAQAGSSLNRMLHLDLRTALADDDLRKVVRTGELFEIEPRFPFLDEDMIEFAARIPPSLKLKGRRLRYFYKRALRDFLPRTTLEKSKHGFGVPFGLWLKTDRRLQEFTYDAIKKLETRNIFNRRFPETVIERHRTGHPSYHGETVWLLLMLELWFEARAEPDRASKCAGSNAAASREEASTESWTAAVRKT